MKNFQRQTTTIFLLMIMAGLPACASLVTPNFETVLTELRPGQYRMDPKHSSIHFRVNHLGLSTYVGRFNDFEASLDFDPEAMEQTRLAAVVRTGSVDVNDPDMEELLAEKDWFDSARHPEAVFTTTSVEPLDDNTFRFTGDLSLRGVTAPVILEGRFLGGATNLLTGRYTLGFAATGILTRQVFGMTKYLDAVGDEISLEIHAEFQKN